VQSLGSISFYACRTFCRMQHCPGSALHGFGNRTMKTLASPSFFRLFDLLLSTTNPGLKLLRWTHDGVEFERTRHSTMGPKHGLAIEIFTLTRAGRRGWTLMVIKEYWWAGEQGNKPLKNLRWARATSGQRSDILHWLRTQEAALERSSANAGKLGAIRDVAIADEEDATEEEAVRESSVIDGG
jgi:hypothetical protein